jgi:hypothetical protein
MYPALIFCEKGSRDTRFFFSTKLEEIHIVVTGRTVCVKGQNETKTKPVEWERTRTGAK